MLGDTLAREVRFRAFHWKNHIRNMIKKLSAIAGFIFVASIIIVSGIHGYLLQAAGSLLLLIALLLTALPISRRLFRSGVNALIFAFPIGFILHGLFLSLWGKFFGISRISVLIYVATVILLAFILSKTTKSFSAQGSREMPLQDWQASDALLLFVWLLLTLALVSIPLVHVGIETQNGYAYRAYFNADFFRNMAVVGSLSNSGIPPDNPYFSGVTLHYYWFFHVIVAYWKTLFPSFRLDFMLVQFTLVTISIFVASLVATLRRFISSRQTFAWLFPIFAFGGSYKGIYVLYELHQKKLHFQTFTTWNIEGVLRWLWNLPQIDTIYRLLLFGPQHVMMLTVFLVLLSVWGAERSRTGWILCYILLFSSLGFSTIIGAVLVLSSGLVLLYQFVRHFRQKWLEMLVFNLLGLLFLFLYLNVFRMFEIGSSQFAAGLNWSIVKHLPLYMILNWGALLIFGIFGIFFASRQIPRKTLLYVLAFCFAFIFFVKLNLPGGSDISLKMGYLSHILLLFFSAALLDQILTRSPHPKRWLIPGVTLFVVPGLITWMMDAYNSQDIKNKNFTTYVSHEDADLFQWMQESLPRGSVVQQPFFGRGYLNEYVTEIPPFAGRSVFLGDKNFSRIFQIPEDQIAERHKMVSRLFQEDSLSGIFQMARSCGIDYLMLGSKLAGQYYEIKQQLIEPPFKLVKRKGSAILFEIASNPRLETVDEKVLLKDKTGPLVKARFADNFYPREFHPKTEEPMRWISNDGTILIHSEKELAGRVEFVAYSLGHNRQMQLYLNQQLVDQRQVSRAGTEIAAAVHFSKGENRMQIHCLDDPEPASVYAGNNDRRLLSFRILHLRFVSS